MATASSFYNTGFFFKVKSSFEVCGINLQKEGRLSCFLYQRSFFYNKARFATNGWHLRWFSFTKDQIRSVPDRADADKHRMKYPKFKTFEFDDKRHIIRIPNANHCKRKECKSVLQLTRMLTFKQYHGLLTMVWFRQSSFWPLRMKYSMPWSTGWTSL